MPIYEYVCKSCEHAFELLVQGDRKSACPNCGSEELAKQFSAFAVKAGTGGAGEFPACQNCEAPGGPGSCPMAPM